MTITRRFAAGKLLWYGKKVQAKLQRNMDKAMRKTAIAIVNTAKTLMREPKSGREPVGRAMKTRASAPGQAPAVQTGQLRGSLATERVAEKHYRVGTGLKKGKHLELGTRKMAARPFLRPAVDKNRDTFERFAAQGPKL